MNRIIPLIIVVSLLASCSHQKKISAAEKEILETEKSFEKMAAEKGMAEAFYFFADINAAVRRGDTVITGRENIHAYYLKAANPLASLEWTPDFVSVSDCGTMGYTYGKYVYSVRDSAGNIRKSGGIFHTVWKKTPEGWKYVWD